MRGSLGLVIGLTVGAGGMYLALERPWVRHHGDLVMTDGGPPVVVISQDAGKPAKKRRRPIGAAQSGTAPADEVDETEPPPVLTAADRKVERRGDPVTLPPRTVDMGGGDEARSLSDAEINSVVAAQSSAVGACYASGATDTDLRGDFTIELLVDGSGKVVKSGMQAPRYLFEHGLLDCARRALSRMHFAAVGRPTVVMFPITLGVR